MTIDVSLDFPYIQLVGPKLVHSFNLKLCSFLCTYPIVISMCCSKHMLKTVNRLKAHLYNKYPSQMFNRPMAMA